MNEPSYLNEIIKNLKSVRRKLRNIDDEILDKLEPATQQEWGKTLNDLSVAILKVETAKLKTLSDEFKCEEPNLRNATVNLQMDLSALDSVVQIIRVASEGLTFISGILKLLA